MGVTNSKPNIRNESCVWRLEKQYKYAHVVWINTWVNYFINIANIFAVGEWISIIPSYIMAIKKYCVYISKY